MTLDTGKYYLPGNSTEDFGPLLYRYPSENCILFSFPQGLAPVVSHDTSHSLFGIAKIPVFLGTGFCPLWPRTIRNFDSLVTFITVNQKYLHFFEFLKQ